MIQNNLDFTRGVIVGGNYVSGQVYFDGRPQGDKLYANSEEELVQLAQQRIKSLTDEFSGWPCYLYKGDKWELRI
jgi:hypothetical protein